MALHVIRVIRELADQGSPAMHRPRNFFCAEGDDARCSKWEPNTDIFECADHVIIRLELAGIQREAISILLKNGRLTISGLRKEKRPNETIYYHQLEIHYGLFRKVISIPEDIEHNDITAVLDDGLLEIKISKNSQVVEIPISVEGAESRA
ncbi:Hsp20/alpha crystallin family protein [bacterium]|nr:Hsp20/alpha crystallin family protein [bacterium]